MALIKKLNQELVNAANSHSFHGKRGTNSEYEYNRCAKEVTEWPISEEKKQKILDKLYEKWSNLLAQEAKHVSVMVAGPAKYNAKKLDHSDKILELNAEISDWLNDLKEQVEDGQKKNSKAEELIEMIEFTKKPDNPCDPTAYISALAFHDNAAFMKYYEELYPTYKWRKNSKIAKLYEMSKNGEVKEIKKEVFFEDENLTAYTESDRAYIRFMMRPQRQLIVALKSRGYWWNSRAKAWSTYLNKLDKEWVASISKRYSKYI